MVAAGAVAVAPGAASSLAEGIVASLPEIATAASQSAKMVPVIGVIITIVAPSRTASGDDTYQGDQRVVPPTSPNSSPASTAIPASAAAAAAAATAKPIEASEHTKNARPSTAEKHEKGEPRKESQKRGGEKGDARRPYSRDGNRDKPKKTEKK